MKASKFFADDTPEYVAMFEEMCHRVGATLGNLDLPGNGRRQHWPHDKYTWTEEGEAEYGKWLTEHMWKNRKALKMSYVTKKRIREHEVPFFLLMYGWKYI